MQVGLYVYRVGEEWGMVMSLDIQVDVMWWLQGMSGWHVQQWLVLSMHLPLSQASWLVDQFLPERSMNMWRMEAWQSYLNTKLDLYEHLSGEIEARRALAEQEEARRWKNGSGLDRGADAKRGQEMGRDGGRGTGIAKGIGMMAGAYSGLEGGSGRGTSTNTGIGTGSGVRRGTARVGGMPKPYPAEYWAQLEQCAALLAERMSGRQLLAAEAEALLAAEPAMPPGGWRAAAQLARLHGRLQMTAALEGPATRRRLAWLGRARSAPRCHRCGSEARQRVPCAACGLAACAYCEACLALGRSRACALLLRSAAQGAVPARGEASRGTALAPTGGGLARWGLSAAQSAAAAAALAFLARPSAGEGPGRFLLWAVTGAGKTEMIFPLYA